MSLKPIAFAWARPRSTRRSLTHRSRKRSVARATAGVPAGPILERASRRRRFRISGRLDSSSTGARRLVMTTASWRQLRPGSSGGSSRTTPRSMPPTNAVEMWTRCGRAPLALNASTRRAAPSRFVWADRSAGLSNSTAAAEWITTSHRRSCSRPSSLSPRPSRPRSISTTASLAVTSFVKRSSPSSSFSRLKAGLERTSRSRRSDAGRRALDRIARLMRATSGIERRHFSTIDLPRKPVLPVTRMVLPFRASAITGLSLEARPKPSARASAIQGSLPRYARGPQWTTSSAARASVDAQASSAGAEPGDGPHGRRRSVEGFRSAPLVSEGSVTQSGNSHDVGTGAVGPTEVRSCGDPEPVALAVLALERRRAVAPRARPCGSSSILRDQVDGEAHGSGAAPPHVDDRGVSLARSRAHCHARQLNRRESWRAPEPEIARVLAPWVRIRASPAIRIHGAATVHVIDAEVQVWAGGGAGHARDADDLTAPDILPLRHVDARQVTVEGEQPVAVVDLDRLSAQARFAAGDEPVGQHHAAGTRRRDRLVVEAVVVSVVARVVQVVVAARRLRETRVERRVRTAHAGRRDGPVVAAHARVVAVVGIAVRKDRGDVVRAHEREREERAPGGADPCLAVSVLDGPVRDLAWVRPAAVLDLLVAGGQGGMRLRRERGQKKTAERQQNNENPHSLGNEVVHARVPRLRPARDLVK